MMGDIFRSRASERGLSLIEVMIAGSVLMVLTLGVAALISRQNKELSNQRAYANRDDLKVFMDRSIRSRLVYALTSGQQALTDISANNYAGYAAADAKAGLISPENQNFFRCLFGAPTNACNQVSSSGLYLLSPEYPGQLVTTNAVAGPGGSSGTQRPVYYKANGARCTTAESGVNGNAQCPIGIVAWYNAVCAGGVTPCRRASGMTLTYAIFRVPGIDPQIVPSMRDLDQAERQSQSFSPIDLFSNTNCPTGQVYLGIDPVTGVPNCQPPLYGLSNDRCTAANTSTANAGAGFVTRIDSSGNLSCAPALSTPPALCVAPQVLTYDATGAHCVNPLSRNSSNLTNTANQSAGQRGACQPGYVVSMVNADGSVFCTKQICTWYKWPTPTNTSDTTGVKMKAGPFPTRRVADISCDNAIDGSVRYLNRIGVAAFHVWDGNYDPGNAASFNASCVLNGNGHRWGAVAQSIVNPTDSSASVVFAVTPDNGGGGDSYCAKVEYQCCSMMAN